MSYDIQKVIKGVTMQHVSWESKYETGVEDIDLQHHYFLNLVNNITKAIVEKQERSYIEALVSELEAYARFHFRSEERMMVHSGYPDYEAHKNHHFDLIQRLGIEQYKLLNGDDTATAEEVIDFLVSWFLEHTSKEDRLFADYLLAQER